MTFKKFSACLLWQNVDFQSLLVISSADTQCVILSECKKDIKPHLRGFNMIDSSLKREMQLIFARAGILPKYI